MARGDAARWLSALALWATTAQPGLAAPMAVVSPPVPVAPGVLGDAGVAMSWTHMTLGPVLWYEQTGYQQETVTLAAVDLWVMLALRRWEVGASCGGVRALDGSATTPDVGLFGRWNASQGRRVQVAGELSAGITWVHVGLPASVRLGGDVWAYTAPRVGHDAGTLGDRPRVLAAPVGISAPLGELLRLNAEVIPRRHWDVGEFWENESRSLTVAASVAVRR